MPRGRAAGGGGGTARRCREQPAKIASSSCIDSSAPCRPVAAPAPSARGPAGAGSMSVAHESQRANSDAAAVGTGSIAVPRGELRADGDGDAGGSESMAICNASLRADAGSGSAVASPVGSRSVGSPASSIAGGAPPIGSEGRPKLHGIFKPGRGAFGTIHSMRGTRGGPAGSAVLGRTGAVAPPRWSRPVAAAGSATTYPDELRCATTWLATAAMVVASSWMAPLIRAAELLSGVTSWVRSVSGPASSGISSSLCPEPAAPDECDACDPSPGEGPSPPSSSAAPTTAASPLSGPSFGIGRPPSTKARLLSFTSSMPFLTERALQRSFQPRSSLQMGPSTEATPSLRCSR